MSGRRNSDEESEEEMQQMATKNINTIFKEAKENIEIAMESKEDPKQKIFEII